MSARNASWSVAAALVLVACHGTVDRTGTGDSCSAGCGAPDGSAMLPDAAAGNEAGLDSGSVEAPPLCGSLEPGGPRLLATRFSAPDRIVAPAGPGAPILVHDYANSHDRYRLIDPATCDVILSHEASPESWSYVAFGNHLAWLEADAISVAGGNSVVERIAPRGTPIALHRDADFLYVLSAPIPGGFFPGVWSIDATDATEAWIDRVPVFRASDAGSSPEPWLTLDLNPVTRWNQAGLSGSKSQLAVYFGYTQLDVAGPWTLLQKFVADGRQRTLVPAVPLALGDRLFVQDGPRLLVYEPDQDAPVLLRDDLGYASVAGIIPPYAIAVDDVGLSSFGLSGEPAQTLSRAYVQDADVLGSDIYFIERVAPDLITGNVWVQPFTGAP